MQISQNCEKKIKIKIVHYLFLGWTNWYINKEKTHKIVMKKDAKAPASAVSSTLV